MHHSIQPRKMAIVPDTTLAISTLPPASLASSGWLTKPSVPVWIVGISDYRSHNAPYRRLNRRGGYFSSAIILRARLRPFSVSV